jgi:signal transduction histidine kinase/CheY-like chemotaxis protein
MPLSFKLSNEEYMQQFWRSVDRFVPPHIYDKPSDMLVKCRLLILLCIPMLVIDVFYLVLFWSQKVSWKVIILLACYGLLVIAIPFLLKISGSLKITGICINLALLGGLFGSAYYLGGFTYSHLVWAVEIPLLGSFFVNALFGFLAGFLYLLIAFSVSGNSFVPIYLANQDVSGFMFIASVITALVITALVISVYELLSRKSSKDLQKARERERKANKAKDNFLTAMSHEIRTPINGVMGMADLLIHTQLNENQREYAEGIKDSSESLLSVVNDILDISRIETGKLIIDMVNFNLRRLIENTVNLLAGKALQQHLELKIEYPGELPENVIGGKNRIRQILINLLENAVKFTERGQIRITVEYREINEDKGVFTLSVIDQGIGIPEDMLDTVFNRFAQADASVTRRFGGTGLGLSICRDLVTRMGGEIGVSSKKDHGTRFWFSLPLELEKQEPIPKTADPRLSEIKVLVMESGSDSSISDSLADAGVRATPSFSAKQIVTALTAAVQEKDPFNFAILELHSSDKSGIELAQNIKSMPEIKDTKLIMLTSHGKRGDADRMTACGVSAYLVKPVHHSMLISVLSILREAQLNQCKLELITRYSIMQKDGRETGEKTPPKPEFSGKVLVAEDNPVNQKVIVKMLELLGLQADLSSDGEAALNMLSSKDYAMILMDCRMPKMDGYQAARKVRELQGPKSQVPIIALTAHAMEEDKEKCLKAGMNDYLAKPIKINDIREMMEKWLR